MEDMLQHKGDGFKPSLVYNSSSPDNWVDINIREFKDAQKTLISFCIQVPPAASKNGGRPKESIFKNSRLMLHEIVDIEDDNEDKFSSASRFTQETKPIIQKSEEAKGEDSGDGNQPLVGQNQRLEVVKITRCKMRAKDTLEIEIGLKNIAKRQKQFE